MRCSKSNPIAGMPRLNCRSWVAGLTFSLLLLFSLTSSAGAASVATDASIYDPGETALIDGSTFWGGEQITLQVTLLDGTLLTGTGGDSWTVTADGNGDFQSSWMVDWAYTGDTLLLTATGESSGSTATTSFLAPKTALNQLQNGTLTASPEWSNGNINGSNSCYSEASSVPYRYFIDGLTGSTSHFFTIEMEWTKGTIHALDYWTDYDLTESAGITLAGGPCGTISTTPPPGCGTPSGSFPWPAFGNTLNYSGLIPSDFFTTVNAVFVFDGPRNLKFYNCAVDSVGKYFFGGSASDRTLSVKVYFTLDTTGSVGFFWAGHLAAGAEWGANNGAASVGGAPYHMRAKDLDGGGGANKDRSIQNGVICLPPEIAIVCDSDTLCDDTITNYVCRDTSGANNWSWSITNGTIVGSSTNDSVVFHVNAGVIGGDNVTLVLEACDSLSGCPGDFCCSVDSVVLPVKICNAPPEAFCAVNDTLFVCDLSDICIPGFFCTDSDGNLLSSVVTGGTLSGDTVCFTPVVGLNTITLVCTDTQGLADTCSTDIFVVLNSPPVATCPPADTVFLCDSGQVCVTGFICTDPDGNLMSTTVIGGTLSGDTVCFTPTQSNTLLTLICVDSCGAADTCEVIIHVDINAAPTAICPPTDTMFVCDLSDICIPGFDCNDVDGNLASMSVSGGTLSGDTVCFTPVAGNNAITLVCVDSCGAADTCTTDIFVILNSPPVATCAATDTMFVCDLSQICVAGFSCTDADGNLASSSVSTGTLSGGSVCFTPVVGNNSITLICTDSCGAADTCTTDIFVVLNSPPVATCSANDTLFVCDLSDICIPGFDCTDADGNLASSSVSNGTLSGDTVCFTPVMGNNTITLICIDSCGAADTCQTTIYVATNSPPVASCPPVDTMYVCDLSDICIPGFDCTDADGNIASSTVSTGTLSGGTVCFTPVAGNNSITLICTDSCGAADTCTTDIFVILNSPPVATCAANDTMFVCDLSTICVTGFGCSDPDGGAVTSTAIGGTLSGDSICFTPTAGDNNIAIVCTDSCGAADTCWTTIHVVVNRRPEPICPPDDSLTLCNLNQICVSGFSCSDPDGNLASCVVSNGVLSGNQVCFTPVVGINVITLIATDSCGLADTCTTTIFVDTNLTPIAGCPGDDTVFVCNLASNICISGFACADPDGNSTTSSVNRGTINNGEVCFLPNLGNNQIIVVCTDSCGAWSSCTTNVYVVVNSAPVVSCPTVDTIRVCDFADAICLTGFSAIDPDGNIASCNVNGQPLAQGNPYCFVPVPGTNTFTYTCIDSCGLSSQCTISFEVVAEDPAICFGCPKITIEKVHMAIQGQYANVTITIDSLSYEIGAFDFLVEYDASALSFSFAQMGQFLVDCQWEYFQYRYGASGNCGSGACPSGKLRITALADVNNGAVHPLCKIPTGGSGELAVLQFLVTNDRTLECNYVPIRFCWYDCGDNAMSDPSGDTLYISRSVFDYFDDVTFMEITDLSAPFPTLYGANYTCDTAIGDGKPDPIRCIDFYNGGIDIACAESLDARGDINLNEIANEVADVVLFSRYFVYGLGVFTINLQGQIAATDVNADGLALSVADLVYQIRIVTGDAAPFPKLAPVIANYSLNQGHLRVDSKMGAAYLVVEGDIEPVLLAEGMKIKYSYDVDNKVSRILVYSFERDQSFSGEFVDISDGNLITLEMATYEGAPVTASKVPSEFGLHQNYPNPFNPTTTISFSLPIKSDYTVTIFNVTGQAVTLFNGQAEAGQVSIEWDATDMASGIYFYRLDAGSFHDTRKMVLLK